MGRRERIAAEAVAVVPAAPAVPVVTTEIVVVPVAEPAPLTRRQLRERELQLRAREAELQVEEIADLEIAPLDSGALEPAVELVLEEVDPDAAEPELRIAEPALHLAPPARRTRRAAHKGGLTDVALDAEAPPTVSAPVPPATEPLVSTTAAAATAPAGQSVAVVATTDSSVEPFVARSASLALAAPASPADVATVSGPDATAPARRRFRQRAASRASVARTSGSPTTPRARGGWAKAGLTAVAMSFVLGITAVTAIPSTVSASPVDANVVNLSLNAGTAPAPQQLITAGAASEVVNRDGYGVTDAGELQAAGYSTAQLLVGRSLAQELVNAVDSGKLVGSTPDHIKEIRWIAQGVTVPDCGVDYRVLEIIAIAVRNFDQVGVSDINRKCTGQIEGAGTSSSHYVDGGGHAVDFYLLNNKSLDGTDAGTLKLISLLDPVMPVGAHVGQAQCRASAGIKLQLTNWTEFDDSCTHMHVDVPVTDAPLLLTDDSLLASQ
jgi:hypothetical protein